MNYSKQREAILKEMRSRHDHPTADMVYESVRKVFPNISLGTVYRNLSLLCETGEIKKVSHGDGGDRYDGFVYRHDHFICSHCGKIIDINEVDQKEKHLDNEDIAQIDSQSTTYYGLCKECI